jgi:general stress protein 26
MSTEALFTAAMTENTNDQNHNDSAATTHSPSLDGVVKLVGKRSFATLATVSPADRPHSAGVLYKALGTTLYVNTHRHSRKARNVAANPHVGVTIPIRRLPIGPPSQVQFQAVAELLAVDDPHIVHLAESGQLKEVTSHGELDDPENVFLRITPGRKLHTYGLGMSLRQLLRDPLNAAGSVELR